MGKHLSPGIVTTDHMSGTSSTVGDQYIQESRNVLAQSQGWESCYGLTPELLAGLIDPKNAYLLKAIGGPERLAHILNTDLEKGLSDAQLSAGELKQREAVYGKNVLPEKKMKPLWRIILETLNDKVLIILIIAAIISLALGIYETVGTPPEYFDGVKVPKVDYVEGVAILVAVVIVTLVGSLNDWNKERQFAKLNKKKEDRLIQVIRGGSNVQVPVQDVEVGDIVAFNPGDILAVDGVVIDGYDIKCDESSATGESDTLSKHPASKVMKVMENPVDSQGNALAPYAKKVDCFMLSGAKVLEGTGHYVVTAVGENSMYGRIMLSVRITTETTSLQLKLDRIAEGIAQFGILSALILFIVLFIRFLVEITKGRFSELPPSQKGSKFMDIFIVSITVIVVAVPEGLPLAVTLSLAFATTRMIKDQCLVRVLKSCETMGNANTVCSDKTGTLTQNFMTVVSADVGKVKWEMNPQRGNESDIRGSSASSDSSKSPASPKSSDSKPSSPTATSPTSPTSPTTPVAPKFSSNSQNLQMNSVLLNSSAYEESGNPETLIGSKTECALIGYARRVFGFEVGQLDNYRRSHNVVRVMPFDSSRKYMFTVIGLDTPNMYRLLLKGAGEIVLGRSQLALINDEVVDIDRDEISKQINDYANKALRVISCAYKDFESTDNIAELNLEDFDVEKGLVYLGMYGIQDPLRDGVIEAVAQCQRASVIVRMVTGDNLATARAIAINAGILDIDDKSQIVMEGPAFRKLNPGEMNQVVPNLRVLARSSPDDKRILVDYLKNEGQTVAVTGDGTNDGPALRLADVGFSMGIAGTEVAKEASDIIIMDDNFSSIVSALKWGRTVNDAVKKFLQFQLTVNVTAVTLTFVSAVADADNNSVLTAVQLLWVNLIMDTLAALALATDPPTDSILDRKPDDKTASLITLTMWKMIFGQSIFQLVVTFVLHFAGPELFGIDRDSELDHIKREELNAMVFNTFVWMQFWNMWVNRRLDNKQNIFEGFTRNYFFIGIMAIIAGFQVLIMFVGGAAFSVKRQTGGEWATALIAGFCSIPVGCLIRLVPDHVIEIIFPKKVVHFILMIFNSIWTGLRYLCLPISWTGKKIGHGIRRLYKKKDSKADKEHSSARRLEDEEVSMSTIPAPKAPGAK